MASRCAALGTPAHLWPTEGVSLSRLGLGYRPVAERSGGAAPGQRIEGDQADALAASRGPEALVGIVARAQVEFADVLFIEQALEHAHGQDRAGRERVARPVVGELV